MKKPTYEELEKRIKELERSETRLKRAEKKNRDLEEQFFHAQKMESLGLLAGGIAHDFNNVLTSVMGYSEMLCRCFDDPNTAEGEAAAVILKGTERAADLMQQLLGFARAGNCNQKPLNINTIIKETLKVSKKIFKKQIHINCDYGTKITNIKADKNQLDQVFTNIFINARDAMPSGGKLNILTQEVFVAERITNITNDIKTGKYVKISITDTGFGIPKEVSDRIFEPFFTTKENGTGLGLASVYGIIKNHDGHIYCESVESKGTTFTILLPASNGETTDEKIEAEISRGDSTILMVDDEEDVRSSVKNTLEGLGYTVLTAGDGNVAVEIYQREKENIDLILLDIVMPGKDGKEIYFELKKFNPDARVLLLSGYSQHGTAQELLNDGALGFIQKPFKIQELSETISEVMSEKDRE